MDFVERLQLKSERMDFRPGLKQWLKWRGGCCREVTTKSECIDCLSGLKKWLMWRGGCCREIKTKSECMDCLSGLKNCRCGELDVVERLQLRVNV